MGMLPEPKTAEDYYIRLKVLNGIGKMQKAILPVYHFLKVA